MSDYNFYMQKVVWDESSSSYVGGENTVYDLESDFEGLKYSKCDGLNSIGEHRVYTEEYADYGRKRVYMTDSPMHKSTEIKLTLFFVGDERQTSYDNFNDYIMDGFHAYWDTARNKKVIFYVNKPVSPSNDKFIGSTPYIEVTYTLSNVYGKTFDV